MSSYFENVFSIYQCNSRQSLSAHCCLKYINDSEMEKVTRQRWNIYSSSNRPDLITFCLNSSLVNLMFIVSACHPQNWYIAIYWMGNKEQGLILLVALGKKLSLTYLLNVPLLDCFGLTFLYAIFFDFK